jgi:hypothetical protein
MSRKHRITKTWMYRHTVTEAINFLANTTSGCIIDKIPNPEQMNAQKPPVMPWWFLIAPSPSRRGLG